MFFLFFLAISCFPALAEAGNPGQEFGEVVAPSGLTIRNKASRSGKKISIAPFHAQVQVISKDGPYETIENQKERWFQVGFQGQKGWAFGGFIRINLAEQAQTPGLQTLPLAPPPVSPSTSGNRFVVKLGQTINDFSFLESGELQYKGRPFNPPISLKSQFEYITKEFKKDYKTYYEWKFSISIHPQGNYAGVITVDQDGKDGLTLVNLNTLSAKECNMESGMPAWGVQNIFWSPSGKYMIGQCKYEGEWFVRADLGAERFKAIERLGNGDKMWGIKSEPTWANSNDVLVFNIDEFYDPYAAMETGRTKDLDKILAKYEVQLNAGDLKIIAKRIDKPGPEIVLQPNQAKNQPSSGVLPVKGGQTSPGPNVSVPIKEPFKPQNFPAPPFGTPRQPPNADAACAACGAMMMGVMMIPVIIVILNIVLLVWVARDAKARGMDGSAIWMILVLFTSVLGFILYIFSRPRGNLHPCNSCGNKRLEVSAKCPHCGNP